MAGHDEDPQLPEQQQLEPPKPQPPQQMTIPARELPVTKQWVENGQMTSMATKQSHGIPVMLPIMGERNRQHIKQVDQCQHGIEHVSIQGLHTTQVNINGRFSQPSPIALPVLIELMYQIVASQDRS